MRKILDACQEIVAFVAKIVVNVVNIVANVVNLQCQLKNMIMEQIARLPKNVTYCYRDIYGYDVYASLRKNYYVKMVTNFGRRKKVVYSETRKID